MEITEITLRKCGALLKGHFLLTSGRHSEDYFEKAEICADAVVVDDLCFQMANEVVSQFKTFDENRIEVVVGLAPIGAVLANRMAFHLGEIYQEKVTPVFTEKDDRNKMVFRRGYDKKIVGKRVLLVDDVLTTGGSVGQVKKEIERLGGEVIGVAVICQRGEVRSDGLEGTPILSLVKLELKDCSPEECSSCREQVPLIDPKSR